MNRKLIHVILILSTLSFIGCSSTNNPSTGSSSSSSSSSNTNTSSTKQLQIYNASGSSSTSFSLSDSATYFCPFIIDGTNLIFPNPDENNRISTIPSPLPKDILQSKNVTDFADYSADNIALIDKIIYFSNGTENNALSSYNLTDKTYKKLTTHSVHNLINVNTSLFI